VTVTGTAATVYRRPRVNPDGLRILGDCGPQHTRIFAKGADSMMPSPPQLIVNTGRQSRVRVRRRRRRSIPWPGQSMTWRHSLGRTGWFDPTSDAWQPAAGTD
jgi:hypothetical protein